ncbi:MAG: tRNA (adenosine(37)-N6)-threonylcarbamoyltransferase complex ATPase subunit type 1 TsaE [Gammaproteobacteria bacterium]|jgi:tRNA threonylcarbamoyladenosine biosynthesis protein TsaE|nr:tRNA (adenosine(37)-N6)-threonylcarbamoyltransferase complex ATPase subunit type 1 TsaE [Gammaproteobacteria bacterium]MDP6096002.1 tRNA (adenosine(37)-N6)-threonylcarbamoyltransferase complex ATPase subunit type 1 TsaE [Gammaproteobacteria bacterium]MDP7456273.1 tRNA (adenosine(37)-N6)-threonylcarbamoyltransferase complex ATPase subunit type 1 TsaE [Gammaproteobacteria bacterium]|tara:strand:+ start:3170 stop:3691 length:522 start_codon:yes stop_codon:yes gene_type:complete
MQINQQFLADEDATVSYGKLLANATFSTSDGPYHGDTVPGRPTSGGIIHLSGELGAGKTTLTRGIMRGYNYTGPVKSPTYTMVEPYEFDSCHIYHFDLYRLAEPEEVLYLGIEDYFRPENLCIVEWPEKGIPVIPAADLTIELVIKGSGRTVNCSANSPLGEQILASILNSRN